MTSLGEFFGRLHLVFLHLPIGFLLLAGAFAAFSFWKKTSEHRPALDWAVGLGALSAALAAACGWLLARAGGYDEALLQRHQWLGFATTGLAAATWLLRRSRWYFPALAVTVASVSIAGHFGGSLTHGERYLFQKIENERVASPSLLGEGRGGVDTTVFAAYIQPIFQKKCVSCHNPQKRKGGLLLDSPDNILKGGKHGPVLVSGQPDASELYRRVTLPAHDDDRMPPKGKQPLSPEEIGLVQRWIAEGAGF